MRLDTLIQEKSVIVVCGAGGVGKTTASSAMGLAAARMGRRALVLTIDPARRLAQALGIPPTGKEPVQITSELLASAGVTLAPGGELSAWMLDPRVVLESVVDRFAPSPEDAMRIRSTRLYQALGEVVSGLQEYTAAEALFEFYQMGKYELLILDTPPSRNALDFLDAPRRLARFLDERTIAILTPRAAGRSNPVVRAAAKVVRTALSRAFGESFADELEVFLGAFSKLFSRMRDHATGVRELLTSSEASFVVVTSPDEAALSEALYFRDRIGQLGLVSDGFVLNRSYASNQAICRPSEVECSAAPQLAAALRTLSPLAEVESTRLLKDRQLLAQLIQKSVDVGGQGALALPFLDEAVEDLAALKLLSAHMMPIVT
ncbi:MAG: AAA family ATPase [Myxococcales bacterium]|nr:AAA family ATPase [Myxococcales bacterium]